jgi:hypothetical protein
MSGFLQLGLAVCERAIVGKRGARLMRAFPARSEPLTTNCRRSQPLIVASRSVKPPQTGLKSSLGNAEVMTMA